MSEFPTLPFEHHGESERWLAVVGWEGSYEVSDQGRVRSLTRMCGRKLCPGQLIVPQPNTHGYLHVGLSRNSRKTTRPVHILVLEAFVGPRPPGLVARHGPGRQKDNRLANLRWGTPEDNQGADRERDGTLPSGEANPAAKLTREAVTSIRARRADGETMSALAAEFGVSYGAIWHLVHGLNWNDGIDTIAPRLGYTRGEASRNAKLTDEIVIECRRRRAESGTSYYSMAREFGVTPQVMRYAVCGLRWTHLPGAVKPDLQGPRAKLTPSIVREVRARYAAGEAQAALAREYGVGHSSISDAISRKTYKHVA